MKGTGSWTIAKCEKCGKLVTMRGKVAYNGSGKIKHECDKESHS